MIHAWQHHHELLDQTNLKDSPSMESEEVYAGPRFGNYETWNDAKKMRPSI